MSDCIFISDLHLTESRPEIIKLFLDFMEDIAPSTRSLYILGDFVEFWIGDDMDVMIHDTPLHAAFLAIERLSDRDTKIYFLPGNRDFLIGPALAEKYSFSIIEDPSLLDVDDEKVLLMHGDTLCTDDIAYQEFRSMVRDTKWVQDFLSKSLEERIEMAKSLRDKSMAAIAEKDMDIMDVNEEAVVETMKQHGVNTLIHGHTHRPALHEFKIDGRDSRRYVLSDWYTSGSYLELEGDTFRSHQIS